MNKPVYPAFTLIELLVVIAIIALLLSVLIVAGTTATDDAKRRETRGVMQRLEIAIEDFKEEGPLKRVTAYRTRYGGYPGDELEVFHRSPLGGVPGSDDGTGDPIYIGPPGGTSDINLAGRGLGDLPNRETAAMALVINLFSEKASLTLGQIGSRYRKSPANPADFFDRNGDGTLDTDDEPLIYFVDAWRNPIDYFAVNTPPLPAMQNSAGTDSGAKDRLNTSRALVRANRGKPLLVSYGPTGPDKLANMGVPPDEAPTGPTPLVRDFAGQYGAVQGVFDNALNQDNVYLDTSVKDRIAAVGQSN